MSAPSRAADTGAEWMQGGRVAAVAILTGAVCLSAMLLFSALSGAPVLLGSLLGLLVVMGVIAALARPRWVFLGFVVACMSVPFVLERVHIPLGFMKLYIQDVVFFWNLLVCGVRWTLGKRTYKPLPFNRYLVLHFLLGLWALIVGFAFSHNEFDEVFGDFRRSYFYFMNYFIAILLVDGLKDARYLRDALLVGAAAAILKGLYEIGAGQFVYRRIGDAAHVLTHFEITFLMFIIYYGLAKLVFASGERMWLWAVPVALGVIVVAVGNFRACWLALIAGLMVMVWFLPQRQRWLLMLVGVLGAGFLALSIATLWDVQITEGHSTIGQEILAKTDVKAAGSDVNVIWRFESYANALKQWQRSPVIGTGLGEVLEFSATTSTGGAMLAEGHRVHNSFLWLLMSLGAVGFAMFLFIQSRFVLLIMRYLRASTWQEGRITVLACGAFYVSIMVAACFEIFLESAMPITVLSSSMALAMLMIYYTPMEATESRPAP
ncbi:MAG: O-antigen ligase family protein [Candidatus Sumerlaeaceae bacterium]